MVFQTLTRTVFATILPLLACGIASAADVVLLDFSSASCAPCQEMRPIVERLAAAGYRVRHVDITREPELAAQFRIDQVPTYVSLVDGREYARMVGTGSYEQLQTILTPNAAVQRGQSPDSVVSEPIAQVAEVISNAPVNSIHDALETPQAGRIIELQDPNRRPAGAPPGGNPFPAALPGNTAPRETAAISPTAANHATLLEASVKISVEDADGSSAGTGTIVDARDGAALLLTCGHLFRTSAGKGPITVTFYQATGGGVQVRETVAGQLLNYDLERDLALVVVRPTAAVKALPIGPHNTPLAPAAAVTTVGCNNGANPTALDSQITTIDRYQGPPNVEVAGAPVEGRSGGGLFNSAGQLIGVCFAADPQSNEGLYASLPSIQAKLDSLNLAMVYQTPSASIAANSVASAIPVTAPPVAVQQVAAPPVDAAVPVATAPSNNVAIRGQDELVDSLPDAFAQAPAQTLSASEQTALEEIKRRRLESEVICIIRPHDPSGKSEVITLNNVSAGFVDSLTQPSQGVTNQSPATAAAGQLLRR
jgi:thiol-disulfide isomerase/thioredoxin